jgi:hypothetical protein
MGFSSWGIDATRGAKVELHEIVNALYNAKKATLETLGDELCHPPEAAAKEAPPE